MANPPCATPSRRTSGPERRAPSRRTARGTQRTCSLPRRWRRPPSPASFVSPGTRPSRLSFTTASVTCTSGGTSRTCRTSPSAPWPSRRSRSTTGSSSSTSATWAGGSRRGCGDAYFPIRGPRRCYAAAATHLPAMTTSLPKRVRRSSSRWSPSPSARAASGRRTSRTLSSSSRSALESCSRVWQTRGCTRRGLTRAIPRVCVSELGRNPKPPRDSPRARTRRRNPTRPPPSERPRRWRVRRLRWRRWRRGRRRLGSPRRTTTTTTRAGCWRWHAIDRAVATRATRAWIGTDRSRGGGRISTGFTTNARRRGRAWTS
mmetsp:Transcript_14849/g.60688  ORF Transcript_14849/g.60688 Transcript_14849/m.60688 type:complete len:317 (+) Transcript_14849:1329-2279(+)